MKVNFPTTAVFPVSELSFFNNILMDIFKGNPYFLLEVQCGVYEHT